MFYIIKNCINKDDMAEMLEYISTIKFNTREDHVPLHDDLFEKNNAPFDVHTRGEMPMNILSIFSKYSKALYDSVTELEPDEYHPPMFSKHYIARYGIGAKVDVHWDNSKPEKTYKSYIFWNDNYSGGNLVFPNLKVPVDVAPGDLIYFIENEENSHGLLPVTDGNMFLSEAWMGHKGRLFMPSRDTYEQIDWNDWEIKGF